MIDSEKNSNDQYYVMIEEDGLHEFTTKLDHKKLHRNRSTLEISTDSLIFENDQLYVTKEIDFEWFSNKLSNIGNIDGVKDFDELVTGGSLETYHNIIISINAIGEINEKLDDFTKESFVTSSSKLVPSN